tara:strand:- start:165 stop:509 length:345 start_codon:yes stop_codon:yes gene_type:complete
MKRNTPKNYHKPNLKILSQSEKDSAFARAKEKIADAGINDIHLNDLLSGKNIGGQYWLNVQPFTVDDPEVIWEMIYNDINSDKIIDHIHNNKGKMDPSKYIKDKNAKIKEAKKK